MAKIPQEAQDLFNNVSAVVFSTACSDGQPNSCIVGMKKIIDDETLYLSDQFFNKTLANVRENPKVCVAWWGEGGAFEAYGMARYVNEGPEFEELRAWANEAFQRKGMPITAKGGVFVDVFAVYNSSPGPQAGDQIS